MTDQTVPQPVARRADKIVVGDRIKAEYLPHTFNRSAGTVLYVHPYDMPGRGGRWLFAAYQLDNGACESATFMPDAMLHVYPAPDPVGHDYTRADDDPEVTQPIAGRLPAHHEDARTGEVVMVGGVTAVEVAGGLIEVDPPEGFVPAGARVIETDDGVFFDRTPQDGHVYECCGKVGRISRHESWCPISLEASS